MRSFSADFNLDAESIWLNCAHQGPLPKCAVKELKKAAKLKEDPGILDDKLFFEVPARLKNAIGSLFNIPPAEVILANSATYTLDILARGSGWEKGDQILLVDGDFPANIYPWLPLRSKGVDVKLIRPRSGRKLTVKDLEENLTLQTKALCVSWVNSFDGSVIDLERIGKYCRENGVLFFVNGSQGFGTKRFDLAKVSVDAIFSCGFKWLLGPYGTGFGWIKDSVRHEMDYEKPYWLSYLSKGLGDLTDYRYDNNNKNNLLDIFGTANFFNFLPWISALKYISDIGTENIEEFNSSLTNKLITGIDRNKWHILSPLAGEDLSSIFVVKPAENSMSAENWHLYLKERKIFTSLRENSLRISPHFYNDPGQIDSLLHVLNN
ncbi:MAG: aminotransferase class V-fold PLP-dependent enzyme [Pyrinomonadaceae bacterium]